MTKDLTTGKPLKLIISFAFPLLLGFLFQQFYSLVDTLIVGRVLGTEALAAVGDTSSINFLIIGFCMGVCNGFSIPVAHKFGAGDYSGVRRCVANCIYLGIGFAIVLTFLTTLLCRNILELMNTPANIIDASYSYIVIIFLGIPTVFLYNLCSGIIRALGDSKTPVFFLVISSFLNICLDVIFMVGLGTGVQGAAFATVISQGISGILCLLYMIKKFEILKIQPNEWAPDSQIIKNLCGMGIPMGLQYSITAIGSVILQTATNSLGSDAVAAVTAAGKISCFLACPFDALGSTMATWAGQNVGAGKLERVDEGQKCAIVIGGIYSVFAFLLIFFMGRNLAMLFISAVEVDIISNVRMLLLYLTSTYFLLALVNIIRFNIQGCGFPYFAILAGVLEMTARSLAGIFLVPHFGFKGVCMGSPLAWILADAFLIPAYFHVMKVLKERRASSSV